MKLPGRATRNYWLVNTLWKPKDFVQEIGVVNGVARVSISRLQHPHRPNRDDQDFVVPSTSTVRHGLRHLTQPISTGNAAVPAETRGYLVLTRLGGRPGGQGGAARLTSEYDVPHRHSADVPPAPLPSNVRRPEGKVRQHDERIRRDIARMSETEVAVFTYAVAHRDRTKEGALVDTAPFVLPIRLLSDLLRLPRSTVHDAIRGLVAKQLLIACTPASGRRPATFQLPAAWHQRRR